MTCYFFHLFWNLHAIILLLKYSIHFVDVPNFGNNELLFLSLISELKTVVEGKVRAFLKKYRPKSYDILMSLKHLR